MGKEIMTFEGAIVKEQSVTFGIAIVKERVLDNRIEADEAIITLQSVLGVIPTVLMAKDSRGTPRYRGRKDIVEFLANVDPGRIPWQRYTTNE